MENTSLSKILFSIYLCLICALCVTSCQQEESPGFGQEVTVEVLLSSPRVMVEARGIGDDPKNEKGNWSTEELLADGSCLKRVTLLIVDGSDRLAGIQDFNYNNAASLPTQVTATFNEMKANAAYRLIAVANWTHLTGFPDLSNLSIGTSVASTITALNNYTLTDTDCVVSTSQPQPLSLVQEFTTSAGETTSITGELLRTYARIRIAITNDSEDYSLNVKGLGFGSESSKFGVGYTHVMPVANIPASDNNLLAASTDAIVPFNFSEESPLTIEKSGVSKVAFDAYIYECKNEEGLNYSLNLEYLLPPTYKDIYIKGDGQNSPTTSGRYMIGYNDNYYLGVNGNSLVGVKDPSLTSTKAIWDIQKNNSGLIIKSVDNSQYIKISNKVELSSTNSQVLFNNGKLYNNYKSYYSTTSYYLYGEGTAISAQTNKSTTFTFYPISLETVVDNNINKTFTIPLQSIVNGTPVAINTINRNDFFNVLVSVSYDMINGELKYKVEDWRTGGGDVTFN